MTRVTEAPAPPGASRAAAFVDGAIAIVVDAVAADLGGPRAHRGVVVVALVAPEEPVAVPIDRRAGGAALAVDERLQVGRAPGDDVARGGDRPVEVRPGSDRERLARRGLGDLLGPGVD